jgi:hypothetical protein
MGYASPGRNNLLYVSFSSASIEANNSPSNIYARGASPPLKAITTYYNDKTRHRLATGPVASTGSYRP